MKKLPLIIAAFAAATSALFAQTLNVTAPGYSGVKLFNSTPGFTITGMGADSSGSVYYLETDGSFAANTKLYKRTAAGGYATATPLFDYGSVLFGSFVTVQAGKVYFGESSTNTIRSINSDGTATLKKMFKKRNFIRLQPANRTYSPIDVKSVVIQGKVLGVIRQY